MATFDEFYSSLDSDPRIRGKQFEKFVKWFLKNDPIGRWVRRQKNEFKNNNLSKERISLLESISGWNW